METFYFNPWKNESQRATPYYTAGLAYDKRSGRVFMRVALTVHCSPSLVPPCPGYPSTFLKEVDICSAGFIMDKTLSAIILSMFSSSSKRAMLYRCIKTVVSTESDSLTSFLTRKNWLYVTKRKVKIYNSKRPPENKVLLGTLNCIFRHISRAIIAMAGAIGFNIESTPANPLLFNIAIATPCENTTKDVELSDLYWVAPTPWEKILRKLNRIWYGYINIWSHGRSDRRRAKRIGLLRTGRLQDAATAGGRAEKETLRRCIGKGSKNEGESQPSPAC